LTQAYAKRPADFGAALLRRISDIGRKHALSLEQKILLAETGTVEQVLSIITGSSISVKVERQKDGAVVTREVTLASQSAGRPLIRARSRIYCENLPAKVVGQIRQRKKGIGTIILQSRLETFRQVVRMGINLEGNPYRVYRILHKGKVALEIREDILI
jgi:chorismate-pyruvate lyase